MKILVTGSSGFLGKFLCEVLRKNGHELVCLNSRNCNLTKEENLYSYNHYKFDQIYHLAAWTQAGDFCLKHPGEQWMINQKINTNLLCWWKEQQPQAKMICMGTSCSYDPTLSLEEHNYLLGKPTDSLFTYAMTKRMLLNGLIALNAQFNLEYLYVIPSTLYGPGYHTDGRQMHFIFDLIRKILHAKLYGNPVVLWGDGEQVRELIHVQDFIDILIKLGDQKNKVINIGAGRGFTIKEFAQKICEITGFPFSQIQFDISKYVGARSKVLHISTLYSLLPSLKFLSLDKGLKQVVNWFLEKKIT